MKKIIFIIILFLVPVIAFPQFLGMKGKHRKHKSHRKKSNKMFHSKPKYLTYSGKKNNIFRANKFTEIDAGLQLGVSQSTTDIGGKQYNGRPTFQDIQWPMTKVAFAAFGRYKYSKNVAFSANLLLTKLAGDDALSPGTGRSGRNKSFTNHVEELSTRALYYLPHNRRLYTPFAYYGFTGLNVFYHNPHLSDPDNDMYDVQLMATPKVYHRVQVGIPFGIGMTYTLPYFIRVGAEITWHKTFTDFLDGFTRPYSKFNDAFSTVTFTASYIIKASKQTQFSTHRRHKLNFRRKK